MAQMRLFIILDGFRQDYLNSMPFLSSLGKMIEIKPIPSFSLRPTIFSGNYPPKTNCFVDFVYSFKSPFRIFNLFNFAPKLSKRSNSMRWLLSFVPYFFNSRRVDPINVPMSLLPFFDISEEYLTYSDEESNLFKELKKSGYDPIVINDATNPIKEMDRVFEEYPEKKVFFLHYAYQEEICFKYGIDSLEMKDYLKKIDSSLKKIISSFTIVDAIIFGDHGMTPVKQNLDLWNCLNKLNLKLNKDYIVFLNSPMARFWFFNNKSKQKILALLASLQGFGHVLSEDDCKKYNIPMDKKFFEVVFYAKEGINISPDFYHFEKIKAMHGYLTEAGPPLILYSTNRSIKVKKSCNMVDIMPTFLDLIKVKKTIKTQGESIL